MPLLAEAHPLSARYAHSLGGREVGRWPAARWAIGCYKVADSPGVPHTTVPGHFRA